MGIISLDVVLVHGNGQRNMPHELACGPFTTMERFRLHVPSHALFLPCDAQGAPHDAHIERLGLDTRSQGFDIQRLCICIEVDQRVTPGGSARQKRRAENRLTTGVRLVEDVVDLPTQRF